MNRVRRVVELFGRPRWHATVGQLNKTRVGRIALYPMYQRWIERISCDRLSQDDIMSLYEFHLRVLAPYFAGWLTSEGVSNRLAKQADDLFVSKIRGHLESISDVWEAKRLNKSIHNFELAHELERMAGFPDRMYLELTDACNLKCPMCTQAVFTHKRTFMELDVLERMMPALRYMNLISFVGCGETLFHPRFREMVESIPNRTAEMRIITNGILLTEDTARFLIEQKLDHLWISLDTTESQTFEIIRESRLYDKIIRQVERVTELKKELGSEVPHMALNFVARRCNIEQLPDFVRMAHRLGAEKVNVGYLSVYSRELVPESLYFHKELSDRYMREAKAVADELGVGIYLPGLFDETPVDEPSVTKRVGIRAFHAKQKRKGFVLNRNGTRLEQRLRPLRRIGAYVPGGKAAYPSTMLMNIIPAQVAGVTEIIVATPPVKTDPETFVPFAVAHMLGVSESIYQMGGAQAIAAMAFGTQTVPRVDKIVGPGNEFVALAKKLLYGVIDIDSVAGNSEVLIIADGTAHPAHIAADLLAQAEHTGGESVVLVGIGEKFDFAAVEREIEQQLKTAPRAAEARSSLRNGGFFIRVETADQAAEVANLKAPEHMEIIAKGAQRIANLVDNVGAIFIGPFTPEPIGDYVAGPNHVLPTGGTARFFSPLGVDAFMKASNVLEFSRKAFDRAAAHVVTLAESEGLPAHAEAIRIRKTAR